MINTIVYRLHLLLAQTPSHLLTTESILTILTDSDNLSTDFVFIDLILCLLCHYFVVFVLFELKYADLLRIIRIK